MRVNLIAGALVIGLVTRAAEPRTDAFVESPNHPAIAYTSAPTSDAVANLNEKLRLKSSQLVFDLATGYLRSTLDALQVPVESQVLVFSATSSQASSIGPRNPRALYFNDTVAVGWVRGGNVLELAAQDERQGIVFYSLEQKPAAAPQFTRETSCLLCHLTWDTLGVPGLTVLSTFQMSDDPHAYATGLATDHRTPLAERWGGWYVTGSGSIGSHRGNIPVIVPDEVLRRPPTPTPRFISVAGQFDTAGYLTPQSDVVALMVLDHQARMTNLITRLGWETRVASWRGPTASSVTPNAGSLLPSRVNEAVRDLVDYLLFVDAAPLPGRIEGSSGFARRFAAQGPFDDQGRSLHQFDLERRLMRYSCSYMIYSPAFDHLPAAARNAVFQRMWQILSGEDKTPPYARLPLADRKAVVEILRATRKDLPAYFGTVLK